MMTQRTVVSDFLIQPVEANYGLGYHAKLDVPNSTDLETVQKIVSLCDSIREQSDHLWQLIASIDGHSIRTKFALPHVAQVLGFTPEGQVIAIWETHDEIKEKYLHLVGETMHPGENPLKAAARGLREETGYVAGELHLLSTISRDSARGYIYQDSGGKYFVIARDCIKRGEGEKEIDVELLSPQELWYRALQYFLMHPEENHRGGNSLELMALALYALGYMSDL